MRNEDLQQKTLKVFFISFIAGFFIPQFLDCEDKATIDFRGT